MYCIFSVFSMYYVTLSLQWCKTAKKLIVFGSLSVLGVYCAFPFKAFSILVICHDHQRKVNKKGIHLLPKTFDIGKNGVQLIKVLLN